MRRWASHPSSEAETLFAPSVCTAIRSQYYTRCLFAPSIIHVGLDLYSHHHAIDLFDILEHVHESLCVNCKVERISTSKRFTALLLPTCRKRRRPFRWTLSCTIEERAQRLENSTQTTSTVQSLRHSTILNSWDQSDLCKTLKCPCEQGNHGPLKKTVHPVKAN